MNGWQRMDVAMRLGVPDRVPVMCQLALGHYFLQAGLPALEIWHSTEAFGEALVTLQRRYGFDGILVNLPGRDPAWRSHLKSIEQRGDKQVIHWSTGLLTVAPADDNPHVFHQDGTRHFPSFAEIDPDRLFYMEPHDLSGISYPYSWGFASEPSPPGPDFFPPWHFDTIRYVVQRVGHQVSVHSEVFSPFSQLMEMLDFTPALLALKKDTGKVRACLDALSEGTIALALGQVAAGAHAVLISSAFAGAGFLSRQHYADFVLPYEAKVIAAVKAGCDIPIYTHTCGKIGDRLDLMEQTGTGGIDTLDPPPLGTVDLAEAKVQTAGRLFLKGNLDPVNTLLRGTPEAVLTAARGRIEIAGPGGGYILSTACSVPPHTPPGNIMKLREAAEAFGRYPAGG